VALFVSVQIAFAVLSTTLPPMLLRQATTHVALLHPEEFHLTSFLVGLARSGSLAPFAQVPFEIAYVAALALCAVLAVAVGALVTAVVARPMLRGPATLAAVSHRAAPILAAMLAFQTWQWVRWLPDRATTLPDMGRAIARIVPDDAVVSPGGDYSFESARTFDSSAVLAGGMFDASGAADYFVALMGHPLIGQMPDGEIERRWPGSVHEASFELTGGYRYDLYRAAPRSPSSP
jgi:hypothetical protein